MIYQDSGALLDDIQKSLSNLDLVVALKIIKKYLSLINKSNYEFLIINLIKICRLNNNSFDLIIEELKKLNTSTYLFKISTYISLFYTSLSSNRYDKALIYLDIIRRAKTVGKNCLFISSLETLLDRYSNRIDNIPNYCEEEYQYIKSKCELLLSKKGIILLDSMDEYQINVYIKVLKERFPNISYSVVNDKNKKRIALIYKRKERIFYDFNKKYIELNEYYKKENYSECINLCKEMIEFGQWRPSVFAKLGLNYIKVGNNLEAIDYLTYATLLSQTLPEEQDVKRYDYTKIIRDLKHNINYSKLESKKSIGTKELHKIISYIYETKLDVETACYNLGLNDLDIKIVKLLLAKIYYSQGSLKKGDEFVTSVERSLDKNTGIIEMLNEIKRNKIIYVHKGKIFEEQLSLTFKPNK